MLISIKNKQLKEFINNTNLSNKDKKEIEENWSMFINFINCMSEDESKHLLVEKLAETFVNIWNKTNI